MPPAPGGSATGKAARVDQIMRVAAQTEARGDFQTSAGLYLRAHDILPERRDPLLRLGSLYDRMGASENAAEAYRRALELHPDDAALLRAYGLSLLSAGLSEAALEQFHRALQLGEDPRLYNALGVTYDSLGARETAQAYYQVGLDLAPGHLSLSANLALSLALSGENTASIAVLDGVAAAAADSPKHRKMVAVAYALAGDETKAMRIGAPELGRDELLGSVAHYRSLQKAVAAVKPGS